MVSVALDDPYNEILFLELVGIGCLPIFEVLHHGIGLMTRWLPLFAHWLAIPYCRRCSPSSWASSWTWLLVSAVLKGEAARAALSASVTCLRLLVVVVVVGALNAPVMSYFRVLAYVPAAAVLRA